MVNFGFNSFFYEPPRGALLELTADRPVKPPSFESLPFASTKRGLFDPTALVCYPITLLLVFGAKVLTFFLTILSAFVGYLAPSCVTELALD